MGDFQGHPFRGNQWTSGGSGGGVPMGTRVLGKSSAEYPPKNPSGRDTRERFSDGKGNYTPERRELHDAIVAKTLTGTTPVRNKVATIVGGGPASGKSTVRDTLDLDNTVKVDVDEIRKELPEYQERVGSDKDIAAKTHEEASEVGKRIKDAAAANNRNLLIDGTGNGSLGVMVDRAAQLRALDYRVQAKYVVIDPEVAVDRMKARAQRPGRNFGRYVPESFVRNTHKGVAAALPKAIRAGAFDDIEVYDNNGEKPRLILRGRRGESPEILDPEAWNRFMRSGE